MTKVKATKVINHFDLLPEILGIQGTFRYRYFDYLEQVEQDSRFILNKDLPDVPRYNLIEWTGNKDIAYMNFDSFDEALIHKESLFFNADLQEGFITYTSDDESVDQEIKRKISDNSDQASRLDYLLTKIASSEDTEKIEEQISKLKGQMPVLDETTNRPIIQTDIKISNQAPDIIMGSEDVDTILKYSKRSPFSSDEFDKAISIAEAVAKKEKEKIKENTGSSRYLTHISYLMSHPDLDLPEIPRYNPYFLTTFELIGYSVSKYLISSNGLLEYICTRFVTERRYKDVYIAYGKKYRYEIRPVFAKYVEPDNIDNERVVFISSDESNYIDIECKEEKSPSPPRNLDFEYVLNSKIKLTWERPESYVADVSDEFGNRETPTSKLYDTDDIKGYQVFVRNSLLEPYRLFKYFTFNNTFPIEARIKPPEIIPEEYVKSYEDNRTTNTEKEIRFYEPTEFTINIRPNTDYYFAMCSIDAHGNTSQYSAQYKIRRNNVTGEVSADMVSVQGAPKQYPNLLIPSKLLRPSFTVSGYRYMDIYYAPDTNISKPNVNVPSTNINLFELTTQVEKNIEITLRTEETNNSSN